VVCTCACVHCRINHTETNKHGLCLRRLLVQVAVPEQTASAGGAAAERSAASASSMSRMLGYLSGRSPVPMAHTNT
jgi:hypothetical protein